MNEEIFFSSAESIQPQDVVPRYMPPLEKAIDAYTETHASDEGRDLMADGERLKKVLRLINEHGVRKYDFLEPERFAGTAIPYTKIRVNDIFTDTTKISTRLTPYSQRLRIFIYPTWTAPGAESPFGLWGEVYRQSMHAINKIVHAERNGLPVPDIEIYSFGAPYGFSGRVTKEWVEAVKSHGFAAYGEVFSDFINQKVLTNGQSEENTQKDQYTFIGFSTGAHYAYETAQRVDVPDKQKKIVQFTPAGIHEKKLHRQVQKAVQIPLGFATEVIGRMGSIFTPIRRNELNRLEFDSNAPFTQKLTQYLGVRYQEDDQEQRGLKGKASGLDVVHLIKGAKHARNIKTHRIEGIFDPVSIGIESLYEGLVYPAYHRLRQGVEKLRNFPSESVTVGTLYEIARGSHLGAPLHRYRLPTSHYINYNKDRVPSWLRSMGNLNRFIANSTQ